MPGQVSKAHSSRVEDASNGETDSSAREMEVGSSVERGGGGTHPDIGILVVFGEIQHVVESQHSWGDLCEVDGRVHMILGWGGDEDRRKL